MSPATARSTRRRSIDRTISPRTQRRVSGPVVRRPVVLPGGAATVPRTWLAGRVRALPEHRMLDRLLRSRLWIWALGAALLGIVAMQVTLLKLNSGISRAVTTTSTLERQNGELEAAIARLSDTDRVQLGAGSLGMLVPQPGDVGYLTARESDAGRAVRQMQPPSEEAAALLANHGIVPGSLAAPLVTTTTTTTTATTGAPDPAVPAPVVPDPAAVAPVDAAPAPLVSDPATEPVTAPDPTSPATATGGAVAPG